MKVFLGVVENTVDITRKGTILCTLEGGRGAVEVTYVSPFVRDGAGFFAVPYSGSKVLVASFDSGDNNKIKNSKYYLLGCVNDSTQKSSLITSQKEMEDIAKNSVVDPLFNNRHLVEDIYATKGGISEMLTLISHSGNALLLKDRTRSAVGGSPPVQDIGIVTRSSTGKHVSLCDSPQIDAAFISNAHADALIFSHDGGKISDPTGAAATYAPHELQVHTLGPINLNSIESGIDLVVYKGKNIELENGASGLIREFPETPTNSHWGGTFNAADTGNEDYGCIKLQSKHRNIILLAEGETSVIRVVAPGSGTKVIVSTGGSVNVTAQKEINVNSATEINITAPIIRINGSTGVWIN